MKMYCRNCEDITAHRQTGTHNTVNVCNVCDCTNMPISIVRERDGLVNFGTIVEFVEWNEEGTFKQLHHEPQIGYSCIIDPQYFTYSWLTTSITEIVDDREIDNQRVIEFKTENSNYKLYISKDTNEVKG